MWIGDALAHCAVLAQLILGWLKVRHSARMTINDTRHKIRGPQGLCDGEYAGQSLTAYDLMTELTAEGGDAYRRRRHLPGLIPLWPEDSARSAVEATEHIVQKLRRTLRAERTRGQAGHWAYDLNRHLSLVIALRAESGTLKRQRRRQIVANGGMSEDQDSSPPR